MQVNRLFAGIAAAAALAGCGEAARTTAPETGAPARSVGATATPIELEAVYSGDPPRAAGTISLQDAWVYVEILDVGQHLRVLAAASDIRIGADWATGVPAESFQLIGSHEIPRRDVRIRWDLSGLEAAGHLPPGPVVVTVRGRDPSTGAEFVGEAEVVVIGEPPLVPCDWDNGGVVTHPSAGARNAHVSMAALVEGVSTLGSNVRGTFQGPSPHFRVADDFELTQRCAVGRIITYAFEAGQPFGSWSDAIIWIWDHAPPFAGEPIASSRNVSWDWSGIYRVHNGLENLQDTANPVMEIGFRFNSLVLEPGTYWIEWQVWDGLSGFTPHVTLPDPDAPGGAGTVAVFGNGRQMFNAAGEWRPTLQPPGAETPFRVVGPPQLQRSEPVSP